jgi:Histidine kinase-, DNA gyrase B-, and HSP90-like ATPase
VGETRVDLQHLLEDLRDAYTGSLEETILTEVVANALDSGATLISLRTDPANGTLTIVDDGRGMQRRELARYHDVAASSKARGEGIGFAGVGIKLGLLVSREVITETVRGATHVATRWHLASRHRAPWKWISPPGLAGARGTAVRLVLTNQLSPLTDAGYVEEVIRRHFEPLFEPAFDEFVRRKYRAGVGFEVDGRHLAWTGPQGFERAPVSLRIGRRRTPSAIGFLERHPFLPADRQGIAISTFGKVIKRGWDWLGITPANPHIGGLIEVPDLAACLTLSKNDFIRTGTRGATYLAYRKAVQEVVSRQLTAWGTAPGPEARPRIARLERDLERVLEDLADAFPLLQSLVDRRAGGQKRLPMPGRGHEPVPAPLFANIATGDEGAELEPQHPERAETPGELAEPGQESGTGGGTPNTDPGTDAEPPPAPGPIPAERTPHVDNPASAGAVETVAGRRRPARYGLLVQFESRPDDLELARLVDSTIWINDAHPAYQRALASRSVGYHTALAVALALASLAVEPAAEHAFITQFLAHWGGAASSPRRAPRRRRR